MTVAGYLVERAGTHMLLEPVAGSSPRNRAPASVRSRQRLRCLLAANTARDDIDHWPETAASAAKSEFWQRAAPDQAILLTTDREQVPHATRQRIEVLTFASDPEWHGLFSSLSLLSEAAIAERLTSLEQQLRRWYHDPDDEFLWLSPRPHAVGAATPTEVPSGRTAEHLIGEAGRPEDEVFHGIRTGIDDGTFVVGDDISERVLASRLGMSRGRIRRGLRSLAEEGLVTVTAESGMAVRLPSTLDMQELYAARKALGAIIVRAASRRHDLPTDRLVELLDELGDCAANGEIDRAQHVDVAFQIALAQSCGLSRVPAMLESLTKQLLMYIALIGVHYDFPPAQILREGRTVFEAVRRGDQEEAVRLWALKMDDGVRYMLRRAEESRASKAGLPKAGPWKTGLRKRRG
ncbi:MAG: GntR family transcriptional regulator [Leucobacter sp.]